MNLIQKSQCREDMLRVVKSNQLLVNLYNQSWSVESVIIQEQFLIRQAYLSGLRKLK